MRPTLIQFIKFGTVGLVGFVFDTALVYFFIFLLDLTRVGAGLLAYPFTVSLTWIGNRLFTFKDSDHEPMAKQWSKFALVCAVGIIFNRGTYSLMVSTIPFVYEYPVLGLLGGTAAGMFFNFFASRKIVFGQK